MPMSTTERASVAARALAAKRTPEQRKAHAHKAYLASAVSSVIAKRDELTEAQIEALREAFAPVRRNDA